MYYFINKRFVFIMYGQLENIPDKGPENVLGNFLSKVMTVLGY